MPTAALRNRLISLTRMVGRKRSTTPRHQTTTLHWIRQDPSQTLVQAGYAPDPWQAAFLGATHIYNARCLLLASRQSGKSLTTSALALALALTTPDSLILILSPTLRQSGELFRDKVLRLGQALGWPLPPRRLTQLELELTNGSRIVSLPDSEAGIRGFSKVRLLIIDEAARVSDDLYKAVRPMLATSSGSLLALSSAWAKQGWFYDAWSGQGDGPDRWQRVKITADQVPRINPAFLEEERQALGERWWRMEYFCEFGDLIGSVFSEEQIARALRSDITPLVLEV